MSILLCVLGAGCGSDQLPTVPAGGKVVIAGGEPVRLGTIEFESVEHGITASGRIQQDGSFTLGTYGSSDGAVPGEHRVIILQMVINDGRVDHTLDHGKPVDPRYANYGTSSLTATVSETGDTGLRIEVQAAK
ncbi:MAG: carboxypeptidase regulatory-like domain-containing protein [Planctomycetaceae bacterium]|nr:carboxypeptidase regulatory-like domain-containing protein [Planctomycetaceae bacterium]